MERCRRQATMPSCYRRVAPGVAAQDAILAGFRAEDVLAIQEKMQFTSEIGLIEALNEAKAYWEPLNWIDLILHVD